MSKLEWIDHKGTKLKSDLKIVFVENTYEDSFIIVYTFNTKP